MFLSNKILGADPNIKESTKAKAPAYTFGGRFKDKADTVSPSPNIYNTTGLTTKGRSDAPSSSLHIKLRDLKKFSTPSPGSYNPQTAEKASDCSIWAELSKCAKQGLL